MEFFKRIDLRECYEKDCWVRPHQGCPPEAVPTTLHLYQAASGIVCHDPTGIPPLLETDGDADRPDFVCYLHEAALRRLPASKEARHTQFLLLARTGRDSRVHVRVVPEGVEHLVPRDAFSLIRSADGSTVVVAPMRTATVFLGGAAHIAAYDDAIALLDKAALSEADSLDLIMSLPIVAAPVTLTAKDLTDEVRHAPVTQRSAPVQKCFRSILRALAAADRNLDLDEISSGTDILASNTHGYLQVLLQDRMVTSIQGRHDPDGTITVAPCKSYTITSAGLEYLNAPDRTDSRDPGRQAARAKPISERTDFYQNQLRDILWVLQRADGYQTIDQIARASALWDREAGERLALLYQEKMVAVLTGHHHKQRSKVRDSRVKSYTITPAGLSYLHTAPPGTSRKDSIETRRTERSLTAEERRTCTDS